MSDEGLERLRNSVTEWFKEALEGLIREQSQTGLVVYSDDLTLEPKGLVFIALGTEATQHFGLAIHHAQELFSDVKIEGHKPGTIGAVFDAVVPKAEFQCDECVKLLVMIKDLEAREKVEKVYKKGVHVCKLGGQS